MDMAFNSSGLDIVRILVKERASLPCSVSISDGKWCFKICIYEEIFLVMGRPPADFDGLRRILTCLLGRGMFIRCTRTTRQQHVVLLGRMVRVICNNEKRLGREIMDVMLWRGLTKELIILGVLCLEDSLFLQIILEFLLVIRLCLLRQQLRLKLMRSLTWEKNYRPLGVIILIWGNLFINLNLFKISKVWVRK